MGGSLLGTLRRHCSVRDVPFLLVISIGSHNTHAEYKSPSAICLFPAPAARMFSLIFLGLCATPLLIFAFTFVKHQIRNAKSPLRKLPGPPSQSWLYGNVKYIFERGQSVAWDEWMVTYGKTFQYPSMFNVRFFSRYSQLDTVLIFDSLPFCLPRIPER